MEKHKEISAEDGTQLFGKGLDREFVGKTMKYLEQEEIYYGLGES